MLPELAVTRSVTGTLETNIAALEAFVADALERYTPERYEGDADTARRDRAELNKSKKFLGERRREIMSALMRPYEDFERRCKALERDIDGASAALDAIVKERENSEKDTKRANIEELWGSKGFTLFSLEKIWNDKWLNKTYKAADISSEMDSAIERTYAELKDIERIAGADCAEDAKARYLYTLDAGDAVFYAQKMKENRESAARESAERAGRERGEKIAEQRAEIQRESEAFARSERLADIVADAMETERTSDEREYVFTVRTTESSALAVKNYLNAQGIVFTCEMIEF